MTGDQAAITWTAEVQGITDGDQPDAPGRRRVAAARHRQLPARRHRRGGPYVVVDEDDAHGPRRGGAGRGPGRRAGNAEAGVEKAFRGYHAALLARDFRTACSYNTPEATDKLLVSLRTQGIDAAGCEDAFAAIYAEEGGSATADGVGTSRADPGHHRRRGRRHGQLDRRAQRRAAAGEEHHAPGRRPVAVRGRADAARYRCSPCPNPSSTSTDAPVPGRPGRGRTARNGRGARDASAAGPGRGGPFRAGDRVQLTDPKGRHYTLTLEAGGQYHTHRGGLAHDELIGRPEGSLVRLAGRHARTSRCARGWPTTCCPCRAARRSSTPRTPRRS